ncbi:CTLH/CRA C-terminal to lish motif domain-containing protein [Cryomyces antarcticus]
MEETLQAAHERLEKKGNLRKSVDHVQETIDLLMKARATIAADPSVATTTLAKLQTPVKQSLDKVNGDLKEIHASLGKYSKALDKKFKDKPLPSSSNDALSSHASLVNRAIAMHLLREGQFSVASTFISEANTHPPPPEAPSSPAASVTSPDHDMQDTVQNDFTNDDGTFRSEPLQKQFAQMYYILHELRNRKNLAPAIVWARQHSQVLETRGSNLEFELCRLYFVCQYLGLDTSDTPVTSDPNGISGPLRAISYAQLAFGNFAARYTREINQLLGSLCFHSNLAQSPYAHIFYNGSAWDEVANSFTREFCSLLGLSADSPLYLAATAGAIALPTLLKLENIMKEKRTEWTTRQELPVAIPLPPSYAFHSIFVCPVSKEQGTDANPPMMMPCGHVIAKETLDRLSKGGRFKCPYCPGESLPRDARRVYL